MLDLQDFKSPFTISRDKIFIFLYILFLFFLGCNQDRKVFIEPIENYLVDSIMIDKAVLSSCDYTSIYPVGDSAIYYLNRDKNLFYLYNVKKELKYDSVENNVSLDKENEQITSFSIDENQSIYRVSDKNVFYLKDRGKSEKRYSLNSMFTKIDSNLACLAINPIQKYGSTFVVTGCFYESDRNGKLTSNAVMHYYDIVFKIVCDSIVYVDKYNPNTLSRIEQDYNSNLWRLRWLTLEGDIIYLFQFKDTLISYNINNRTVTKRPITTKNFVPNTPFDETRFYDEFYKNTYDNSQSTFHSIKENPNDSSLYLFLKHQDTYVIQGTGEKRDYDDAAFSLLHYDKNLVFMKELLIPSKKYYPLAKFVLDGKLYISEYKYNPFPNGKVKYYIFSIPSGPSM